MSHLDASNRVRRDAAQRVPPFLFRAYSDSSRGVNSQHEIRPNTERQGQRPSIFAQVFDTISNVIQAHLLWYYNVVSDFSSWTSSFLFAAEHAARMHVHEQKRNVHIAILDARKVPDMALYPAPDLMAIYGILHEDYRYAQDKLRARYCISEYLFFGPLRNSASDPCYTTVSWEVIHKADLGDSLHVFTLRPSYDAGLQFRIARFRSKLDNEVLCKI